MRTAHSEDDMLRCRTPLRYLPGVRLAAAALRRTALRAEIACVPWLTSRITAASCYLHLAALFTAAAQLFYAHLSVVWFALPWHNRISQRRDSARIAAAWRSNVGIVRKEFGRGG